MSTKRISQGSRVKLSPKSPFYSNELKEENPTDCEGTVCYIEEPSLPLTIKWDNGVKNCYAESDLILTDKDDNHGGAEWQEFLDHTDKELFQEESKKLQEERETLYSRLKAFDQLAHEQHAFLEEAAQFLPLDEYTRYKALSEKYAALCGRETDHLSPHQNQIL